MHHINIEIKAKSNNNERIRSILNNQNAEFKGIDTQTDTYFNTNSGRLKMREGNIENSLIYYERDNTSDAKESRVTLYKSTDSVNLKKILANAIGIMVKVEKQREIYFIDNVKFHLDKVTNLGEFVEIEVIGNENSTKADLTKLCQHYIDLFEIKTEDLLSNSYSDMLCTTANNT